MQSEALGNTPIRSKVKNRNKCKILGTVTIFTILACGASYALVRNLINSRHELESKMDRRSSGTNNRIDDGLSRNDDDDDTNPETYVKEVCTLPNYLSQDNGIFMDHGKGSLTRISIKGVNWFGMETGHGIPYGLTDNKAKGTGTTVYEIVSLLSRHNFNSVRLPLCVESYLNNVIPNEEFINKYSHLAIDASSYRSLLQSLIKALSSRGISVLLDFHKLSVAEGPNEKNINELWYSEAVPESKVLETIDLLAEDLCHNEYWNIIGLDLKNEPNTIAKWGEGPAKYDWLQGAEKLGNRLLAKCEKWLVFVEGIDEGSRTLKVGKENISYNNFWGSGLERAYQHPVKLSKPNKLVYSPHYYNAGVHPHDYMFLQGDVTQERDDESLKGVIQSVMNASFGYLNKVQKSAVVLGEVGGIYSTDKYPKKSNKRMLNNILHEIADKNNNYAGGYIWSLNPEGGYGHNGAVLKELEEYGIFKQDWRHVWNDYLNALEVLDEMPHVERFPCVPV